MKKMIFVHAGAALLDMELRHLEDLIDFLEDSLSLRVKGIERDYLKLKHSFPEDADYDPFEPFEDEYWKLSDNFPQKARESVFSAAYSIFEVGLKTFCRQAYYAELSKDPPRKTNFHMREAFTFLTGNALVQKRFFDKKWQALDRYRLLRNLVVHEGATLPKRNPKPTYGRLRWFIGREQTVSIDHRRRVRLNQEFCPKYIQLIRAFFADLLVALTRIKS